MNTKKIILTTVLGTTFFASQAFAADSSSLDILKQGLLGAGTGAIASSASGGNAGKGALIGAGTNVIGGALLGFLTGPSASQQPSYTQSYYSAPQPVQTQPVMYQPEPVYVQPAPIYTQPQPQIDPSRQILKQGLLGAGTGAIAASASGGNAGKGALIGAGTNVIGGALLDTLTSPPYSQQAPIYYPPQSVGGFANYPQQQPMYAPQAVNTNTGMIAQKRIIRKYDTAGNIVSEEEIG